MANFIDTSESDMLIDKLAWADARIQLIGLTWLETPGELPQDLRDELDELERMRNEAIAALDRIGWGDPNFDPDKPAFDSPNDIGGYIDFPSQKPDLS